MKKRARKEVSVNKLAIMVQNGFSSVSSDIQNVESKLGSQIKGVEGQIKGVEERLTSKINHLTRRVDAMVDYNRRIARLERIVDSLVAH